MIQESPIVESEEVVLASPPRELATTWSTELVPAAQAAAVAAGTFVAGAVTMAVMKRASARRASRRRPKRALDMLPIVGSRSFLVDIHLISRD